MTELGELYRARDDIVDRLTRDLLGPSAEDEELYDRPLDRYVVGILYPASAEPVDPAQDDKLEDAVDDEGADPPVSFANSRYPSSCGLTFAVDSGACTQVNVSVSAAR